MQNKINVVLLLLFFNFTSIYANSLLEMYRLNGIEKIKKDLDKKLSHKEYWDEFIKDKDTTFGYIESYSSVLTCDKNESTLNLYLQDTNKTFILKENYSAFTGEAKGDKVKEGDLKTPVGVYQISKKISNVDPFYGPLAFVTTYPNTYDKYRGKTGSGIWIHGLPINQKRDDFTRGCIAINNENIVCLSDIININKTLLIINPTKVKKHISKDLLASILSQLYKWRFAWIYNDTKDYLDFYSDDFVRHDGMKYDEFTTYKTRIFKKSEKKSILFNNINIIPYPGTSDVFQITFIEYYSSPSFSFSGEKVLMVRLDENNNIKIFTEK